MVDGKYPATPDVPTTTLPRILATPPSLAAPPPPGPWHKKEKEVLSIPKDLPVVNTWQVWLAKVAAALTEASVHSDKAVVGWLVKATGNSEPVNLSWIRVRLVPMGMTPCSLLRCSPRSSLEIGIGR
jgi:hypothetical protein